MNINKFSERPYLVCKDHLKTGEVFELRRHLHLDMLKTFPVPEPEEMGSYYEDPKYISHQEKKLSLVDHVYHLVKDYMVGQKIGWIAQNFAGKNLLDIGAGTGSFLAAAEKKGWRVAGVEPNEKARKIASTRILDMFASTRDISSETYDVITLWHVLEHFSELEKELEEVNRLLTPGGGLVVAVPNFRSLDAQHYGPYWAGYDVPRHVYHFAPSALIHLIAGAGFRLEERKPLFFDSFYVSMLSEKYRAGSFQLPSALWTGLRSNLAALRSGNYSSSAFFFRKMK